MMMLVPLILISIMNLLLYITIRNSSSRHNSRNTSRQRRDLKVVWFIFVSSTNYPLKVAMLLITVVLVFIGCNMIRICINTYEVWFI